MIRCHGYRAPDPHFLHYRAWVCCEPDASLFSVGLGGLERLTYYLFFPALLISRLSATRFEAAKLLDIGLSLGLACSSSLCCLPACIVSLLRGVIHWARYIRAVSGLIPTSDSPVSKRFTGTWADACSALSARLYPGSERVKRDRPYGARS